MKTKMLPALLLRREMLVPMCALLASGMRADGAMATGLTDNWRAFALSGGKDSLEMSGNSMIMGKAAVAGYDNDDDDDDLAGGSNVGVGPTRTFSLSGNAMISGVLAYDTRASGKVSGGAVVQGGYQSGFSTNLSLTSQANAAIAQSASYAAMTSNSGFASPPTKIKTSTSLTLSGTNPGLNVLNLSELTLSGGAVLTLNGGLNSQFLINVDKKFSLDGNSSIVLSGGVKAEDVVFNYKGKGAVTMSGNTTLNGVVMATGGEFQGSGNALVKGQVIAGKIKLSGNAKIVSP